MTTTTTTGPKHCDQSTHRDQGVRSSHPALGQAVQRWQPASACSGPSRPHQPLRTPSSSERWSKNCAQLQRARLCSAGSPHALFLRALEQKLSTVAATVTKAKWPQLQQQSLRRRWAEQARAGQAVKRWRLQKPPGTQPAPKRLRSIKRDVPTWRSSTPLHPCRSFATLRWHSCVWTMRAHPRASSRRS